MCMCVWLPLHSAIGGHFVCCCPPKMRLNRKVATWDELSFPSSLLPLFLCHFLAVSLLLSLCPFLGAVRLAFSSGGCHGNTHTYTRILQAPFCCQVWCVFVCVLSAFRRAWLVLALALAIYSAVCCDPTSFCGFSTVVDSQTGCAGIGLRPGGQRSCLCVACHIFVLFAFLTCSLIDRLRPFLLSPIHVCFLISFHVNYGYKRWLISFYIP